MGKRDRPKKYSTLYVDRGRISRHILPLLNNKLVRDVIQMDLNHFVHDVAGGKTATIQKTEKKRGKAIVEGGKGTAARTVRLLGGILSFAVSEGVIPPVRRAASSDRQTTPRTTINSRGIPPTRQGPHRRRAGSGDCTRHSGRLAPCSDELPIGRNHLKWAVIDEAVSCFRLQDSKEGASQRPVGRAVLECFSKIEKKMSCPYVLAPCEAGKRSAACPRLEADRAMLRAHAKTFVCVCGGKLRAG